MGSVGVVVDPPVLDARLRKLGVRIFSSISFSVDTSRIDSASGFSACGSPPPAPQLPRFRDFHAGAARTPLVEGRIAMLSVELILAGRLQDSTK